MRVCCSLPRSGRTTPAALQPTNFSKRDRVVICVVSVDFGRECLCRRAHNTSPPHDYLHMPRSLVSPYLFRFLIGRRRKSAWTRHSSLASMTSSDNSAHRFPPQRTLVTILQSASPLVARSIRILAPSIVREYGGVTRAISPVASRFTT